MERQLITVGNAIPVWLMAPCCSVIRRRSTSLCFTSVSPHFWRPLASRGIWRGQLVKFYIIAYLSIVSLANSYDPNPACGLTNRLPVVLMIVAPIFVLLWGHDAKELAFLRQHRERRQSLARTVDHSRSGKSRYAN